MIQHHVQPSWNATRDEVGRDIVKAFLCKACAKTNLQNNLDESFDASYSKVTYFCGVR
jgi:hypothetical protein